MCEEILFILLSSPACLLGLLSVLLLTWHQESAQEVSGSPLHLP